jgi:hypothetical protein
MVKFTKWLIWLYLILLIFEGSLRKWIVPSMADPLLVVRDPVLLGIYICAIASGRIPRNAFLGLIGALALVSIAFSFLGGQSNLLVLAYGLRTNYLHIPLIWVAAEILDRNDVEKMGTFLLLCGLAMTAIMVQQFRSPASARINCGVGGEEGGQLNGAMGKIRPPGFFSFIIGPTVFFPVYTAFLLEQFVGRRRLWWPILIGAGVALVVALVVSISRGTLIGSGIVGIALVAALLRIGVFNMAFVRMGIAGVVILAALSFTPAFKEGREAFMDRWNTAAQESGGQGWGSLMSRVTAVVDVPLQLMSQAPFFGHGVGYGSNVAARILTGSRGFLLAEDEWTKCYLELGPILGSAFLGFRVLLTLYLMKIAWRALIDHRDALPFMLWTAIAPAIVFYQWAQPTVLGFVAIGATLLLASTNYVEDEEDEEEFEDEDAEDSEEDDEDEDSEEDENEEDETEVEEPVREIDVRRRRMRGL